MIVIVYGPARSGKTANAEGLRSLYRAARVVDGWDGQAALADGDLALTNETPPYVLNRTDPRLMATAVPVEAALIALSASGAPVLGGRAS